jgi:hypothetical protein
MKLMHLFYCGLIVFSCSERSKEIKQETHPKLIMRNGIAELDDSYASYPLNVENFKEEFSDFILRKEPVVYDHLPSQIDTLLYLSNGMDSLKIYQVESKQFLLSMSILTKRIRLNRDIYVGMPKRDFYHKFESLDSINTKPNSVLIWDITTRLNFLFREDTLSQITWISEID